MALRRVQIIGYGAGDAANNLTFSLVSAFLLIYYTDVAGISAAAAGTLFLIVRIFGGVADLFAGRVVDRTDTRWGRFRPYVLFGSIPLLLLGIALFSIPGGLDATGTIVFAYVSYLLFQLAYSFVNIPYGSLSAVMTQDPDERSKLSTGRVVSTSLTLLAIALVVSPQISGGGDLQRSLTLTTIVFAVIGFGLYLWCFLVSRETVPRGERDSTIGDTLKMMRHNLPMLLLCGSTLLFLAGQFSVQTVAVYYARSVLGDTNYYIVLTVVSTIAMIIASLLVPGVGAAIGKKQTYLLGAVITVVAGVGAALAPGSIPWAGVVAYGVMSLGLGLINNLIFAMQPDTVDYGEWRTGTRAEGGSYAVLSFTRKAGQGIGGGLAAYTLGVGGYVSTSGAQTAEAVGSIRVAFGLLPAAAALLAGVVMLAYPLTKESLRSMVEDMAARRAQAADPG